MSAHLELSYLQGLGLKAPESSASANFLLSFAEELPAEAPEGPCMRNLEAPKMKPRALDATCEAARLSGLKADSAQEFKQAFKEAFASALTKFDSLDAYFATGMSVLAVCEMLADEMRQDRDFEPALAVFGRDTELQTLLRKFVGTANGKWKEGNRGVDRPKVPRKLKDNPLPWASIDAYPEWVVGQIETYASAAPEEQVDARTRLERTLLERPLCAASVKYDGTCFGKLDTGELVGRKQLLGTACDRYQHTSTAAAEQCNVAALRCALSKMLDVELGRVCVWGELMCNPGFYSYKERGLAAKWLCFGVVTTLDGLACDSFQTSGCSPDKLQCVARKLSEQGFAYSTSEGGKLRLLLCPALRQLLQDVAVCEVVDEQFHGLTHAEVVAEAADGLSAGAHEGLVLVFARPDGQSSLRKWKNSAEGASVSKKHAQLLRNCQDLCSSLVAEGRLDARVVAMLATMQSVAEARTSPMKTGRTKVAA